jgi:uncharacterized protein (TIGR02588 family)
MPTTKVKKESRKNETPLLEWMLGGIGVLLLSACVVFLVHEGLNGEESPGAISVEVKQIVATNGMHVVTFELHNAGSQTLSNVHLTGRLSKGDTEIERVQTVLDYLPGHSQQEAGFYFKHDPRTYTLEIVPEGYQKP